MIKSYTHSTAGGKKSIKGRTGNGTGIVDGNQVPLLHFRREKSYILSGTCIPRRLIAFLMVSATILDKATLNFSFA